MATGDLQKFRRQARDEILRWMESQTPPVKKSVLADQLGYHPSQVSKSLSLGRDMANPKFLERIAEAIPELAWLKRSYYELMAGLSTDPDKASAAKRRADVRRRIGELEREANKALKQAFEAVKELVDE